MVSILFFIAAAVCNSLMDTSVHHYPGSVFAYLNYNKWGIWWDGSNSWRNKYVDFDPKKGRKKLDFLIFAVNVPVQLTDAFHFFKMLMIFFIVGACVTFNFDLNTIKDYLIAIGVYGLCWNGTFSLFYDWILIKKK